VKTSYARIATHVSIRPYSLVRITVCNGDTLTTLLRGLTENAGHETDGPNVIKIDEHEIGRQYIYRLKMDYITMHCAILLKTTAEHK